MTNDSPITDTCGNCRQPWPCGCAEPVRICGICGGDQRDCKCDERSHLLPVNAAAGQEQQVPTVDEIAETDIAMALALRSDTTSSKAYHEIIDLRRQLRQAEAEREQWQTKTLEAESKWARADLDLNTANTYIALQNAKIAEMTDSLATLRADRDRLAEENREFKEFVDAMQGAADKILATINGTAPPSTAAPGQSGDGWISVEDRLPEKMDDRLVSADVWITNGVIVKQGCYCYILSGPQFWSIEDLPIYSGITHWMPIPPAMEPPSPPTPPTTPEERLMEHSAPQPTPTRKPHNFVTDSEGIFCTRCGNEQGRVSGPCRPDGTMLGDGVPSPATPDPIEGQARAMIDGWKIAWSNAVAVNNQTGKCRPGSGPIGDEPIKTDEETIYPIDSPQALAAVTAMLRAQKEQDGS